MEKANVYSSARHVQTVAYRPHVAEHSYGCGLIENHEVTSNIIISEIYVMILQHKLYK